MIEKWLPKVEKGEQGDSAPDTKGDEREMKIPKQQVDRSVLDTIRQLGQSTSGNILERVVNIYLQNTPELIETIRNSIENRQYKDLRMAAHTLKSSSANVGAIYVAELCKALEDMGRDEVLVGAEEKLRMLEEAIPEVGEILKTEIAA